MTEAQEVSKPTEITKKACQLLKQRVCYETAHLSLPGNPPEQFQRDTAQIQAATESYVEKWILPLLNALERGDTDALRDMTR